jgi:hypothetical protein
MTCAAAQELFSPAKRDGWWFLGPQGALALMKRQRSGCAAADEKPEHRRRWRQHGGRDDAETGAGRVLEEMVRFGVAGSAATINQGTRCVRCRYAKNLRLPAGLIFLPLSAPGRQSPNKQADYAKKIHG